MLKIPRGERANQEASDESCSGPALQSTSSEEERASTFSCCERSAGRECQAAWKLLKICLLLRHNNNKPQPGVALKRLEEAKLQGAAHHDASMSSGHVSGNSSTCRAGEPSKIDMLGTTVPGATTAPSAILAQSLMIAKRPCCQCAEMGILSLCEVITGARRERALAHRLTMMQFLPISTMLPI